MIKQVMLSLPNSSEELKYYWSSRLVLRPGRQLSQQFSSRTAEALQLKIAHFEDAQTPEAMAIVLNTMVSRFFLTFRRGKEQCFEQGLVLFIVKKIQ